MKNTKVLTVVAVAIILAVSISVFTSTRIDAQETQDMSEVLSKLDKILSNQMEFSGQLESLRQELNIIKIRITQQQ